MDGHFVDNLALNFDTLKQVRNTTNLPIDVHLMVNNPEAYMERALAAGADLCIFHREAARFPLRIMRMIHAAGAAAGIAINPATPAESVKLLLPQMQMVLVMLWSRALRGRSRSPCFDKIASYELSKHSLILLLSGWRD